MSARNASPYAATSPGRTACQCAPSASRFSQSHSSISGADEGAGGRSLALDHSARLATSADTADMNATGSPRGKLGFGGGAVLTRQATHPAMAANAAATG